MPPQPDPVQPPVTNVVPAKRNLTADIIGIVGFIILIVVIIWGLIHLVSLSRGWFTGFVTPTPTGIVLSAPKSITSDVPFKISWTYKTSEKGAYAFLYPCQRGLNFQIYNASTSIEVPCSVAYTMTVQNNSIPLRAHYSGATSTSEELSVIFIPSNGGAQVRGSAQTTVVASSGTAPVVLPSQPAQVPTQPQKPATTVTKPNKPTSPADLTVRILRVGYIDPQTGLFAGGPITDPNQVAAVEFDIQNVGGSTSGSYTFNATLPTAMYYPFSSAIQSPLGPGDHVQNTLRFTQVAQGGGVFTVTINGSDANYANNGASIQVQAYYPTYQQNIYNPYTVTPPVSYPYEGQYPPPYQYAY